MAPALEETVVVELRAVHSYPAHRLNSPRCRRSLHYYVRPEARSRSGVSRAVASSEQNGNSSAGCAILGHDATNVHGVVPLRPVNGKGPECVRYSFVQYSKDPCYKRTRGEAEARARGDPEQLRKDAEKAAKKAIALARAERKDKRKRE